MPPPPSPTVFVIDDDAAVRKAVSRLLRSAGIAVAVFASPREFLAQYDPDMPGCLVLDLAMPDINGLQLQTTLGMKGCTLPIIFLTGHGDVSKSVQAMKHGAFDFFSKPGDSISFDGCANRRKEIFLLYASLISRLLAADHPFSILA